MSNKKEDTSLTPTPIIKKQLQTQAIVDLFLELMIVNNISSTDAMNAFEFILNGTQPRVRNK